jgi:5'-3' exonuclease
MNFILIDGSYFIYHRYFSLKTWWKNAKRSTETDVPYDNERFIEKFKSTLTKKIHELAEIYSKSKTPIVMVAKDCPSENIWRRRLFAEYKYGRRKDEEGVAKSFATAYGSNLFMESGVAAILYDDELEADDCIAITTRHITGKYPNATVDIITSDMDYLQLVSDRVHVYNLKGQALIDSKQSFKNADKDLFCKIVAGDKSDNIQSVFPRCGPKTAERYYHNRELFRKELENDENAKALYDRNKILVDLSEIPEHLVERFKVRSLLL